MTEALFSLLCLIYATCIATFLGLAISWFVGLARVRPWRFRIVDLLVIMTFGAVVTTAIATVFR